MRVSVLLAISNLLLLAWIGWLTIRVQSLETTGRSQEPTEELSTERINIIGPNGNPVLVLAGRHRIPGPAMDGKVYAPEVVDSRPYLSGMIFFNDEGDEVGSFLFNGFAKENGGTAVGHLSMDQWKQNQVVALQYNGKPGHQKAGLSVWQRPTDRSMKGQLDLMEALLREDLGEEERSKLQADWQLLREEGGLGVHRLFVGDDDGDVGLTINDDQGRERLRLGVAASGAVFLRFLDESGEVTDCLPTPTACPVT